MVPLLPTFKINWMRSRTEENRKMRENEVLLDTSDPVGYVCDYPNV